MTKANNDQFNKKCKDGNSIKKKSYLSSANLEFSNCSNSESEVEINRPIKKLKLSESSNKTSTEDAVDPLSLVEERESEINSNFHENHEVAEPHDDFLNLYELVIITS